MKDKDKELEEVEAEGMEPEEPEQPKAKKKEPEIPEVLEFEDGTAVAAAGLGIHLIQDGKRRWVPDTFTQAKLGIRMDYVVNLFPEQLLAIPEGKPMPSRAPEEPLF